MAQIPLQEITNVRLFKKFSTLYRITNVLACSKSLILFSLSRAKLTF